MSQPPPPHPTNRLPPSAAKAAAAGVRPPPPGGIPLPILGFALCLVPISLFAGWVITYGTDEEALERTLREKYGNEIRQVEGKTQAMQEMYKATIKDPGSNAEQERRLQQVLRGGRGDVKRHHDSVDKKYYGTAEGKANQTESTERMAVHQEEERERAKRVKKKLRKLKRKRERDAAAGITSSSADSENESDEFNTTRSTAKAVGAATAVTAVALAATATATDKNSNTTKVNPFEKVNAQRALKKLQKQQKKDEKARRANAGGSGNGTRIGGIELSQVASLTAVAGAAALLGFLVGGGSRRQ